MLSGSILVGHFMICKCQMSEEGVGWFWLETETSLHKSKLSFTVSIWVFVFQPHNIPSIKDVAYFQLSDLRLSGPVNPIHEQKSWIRVPGGCSRF